MSTETRSAQITQLILSDTFNTWYNKTNEIIQVLNSVEPLRILNGPGINISDSTDSSAGTYTLSLNLTNNSGLTIKTDNSVGLDIFSLQETTSADTDYFILQRDDTSSEIYKVNASNILPLTINGNHIFSNTSFTNSYISFETENLFLNCTNVLVENSYLTLNYSLDTDGDFYTKSLVTGGIKVPTLEQIVKFEYKGSKNSWLSNVNIGVSDDNGFVNDNSDTTSIFNFKLLNTQNESTIRIQKDVSDYWCFRTDNSNNSLIFGLERLINRWR